MLFLDKFHRDKLLGTKFADKNGWRGILEAEIFTLWPAKERIIHRMMKSSTVPTIETLGVIITHYAVVSLHQCYPDDQKTSEAISFQQ